MRVLIGYDGSPSVEQAIADLRRAGFPTSGTALVLSVADVLPPAASLAGSAVPPAFLKAKQAADLALTESRMLSERGAALVTKVLPGWSVSGESVADSPFWGLVKRAEQWRADLVVVGVQGRSAVGRLVLGSVSHTVASNSACSVRIGRASRRKVDEPARLVVGVDGSRDAARAVSGLAERRWPAGSSVAVIAVIDAAIHTALASSVDPYVIDWARPYDEDAEAWIARAVEAACAELQGAGLTCEPTIARGDPKRVLVEQAEQLDADCVFVGAQGLTRIERFFLGSVSAAVAGRAHCSVEIVRRAD